MLKILPSDFHCWKFLFRNLHLRINWPHLQYLPYCILLACIWPLHSYLFYLNTNIYIFCFIFWTSMIPSHALVSVLITKIFWLQILRLSSLYLILLVICKNIHISTYKDYYFFSSIRLYYTQPDDGCFQGETCSAKV